MLTAAAQALEPPSSPDDITFAHWNPRWRFFLKHSSCEGNATTVLDSGLLDPGFDFVNVVELEASTYEPPTGWPAIAKVDSCGRDTLFFSTAEWRPARRQASGCVVDGAVFCRGHLPKPA